jgi:hypothetical protein
MSNETLELLKGIAADVAHISELVKAVSDPGLRATLSTALFLLKQKLVALEGGLDL